MKKTLLFLLLTVVTTSFAQQFNYTGTLPTPVPNTNTNTDFPIVISGLPQMINSAFGLSEVQFSFTHPQVSDLKISLQSPDGNNIILSLHNGNGGSDYTNTHLSMNASVTMTGQIAPYNGNFLPDQSLNYLNNGQDPNGVWKLTVIDAFPLYSGQLTDFKLTFSANPPPDPAALQFVCSTTNASGCFCKDTTMSDCNLLPDLICSARIIRDMHNESLGHIGFSNTVINIGSGPLEMKPTGACFCDTTPVSCATVTCPNGLPPKEQIAQRVYHKNPNGQMTYYDRPAGTQSFHTSHNHVHVQDFTEFSLRTPTADPNPANWPIIANSIKQGYCLLNMGSCDTYDSLCMSNGVKITNADLLNYNFGSVTGCGNQGQGIFVGRYDMYGAGNGQEINMPGICNGDYYIVARIDPFNFFEEEDETNNAVAVPIHLTQQAGAPLNASFVYTASGLTAAFINYTPGVTVTWNFGDGTSATSFVGQHTYAAAGTYTVTCTVFDGSCASTSAQSVTIGTVGLDAVYSGLHDMALKPNPSSDHFALEYQLINPSEVTIDVLNIMGEKVKEVANEYQLAGKHNYEISNLDRGVYFVRLNANDQVALKRIVKL